MKLELKILFKAKWFDRKGLSSSSSWVSSHWPSSLAQKDWWPWWAAVAIPHEHQLPRDMAVVTQPDPSVSQSAGLSSVVALGCALWNLRGSQAGFSSLELIQPLTTRSQIWASRVGDDGIKWPPVTLIVPPALNSLSGVEQSIFCKCLSPLQLLGHRENMLNSKVARFWGAESPCSSFCVFQENGWERDIRIPMWKMQDPSCSTGLRCLHIGTAGCWMLVHINCCRWRDKEKGKTIVVNMQHMETLVNKECYWSTLLPAHINCNGVSNCSIPLCKKSLLWLLVSAHPKEPDTKYKSQSETDEMISVYMSFLQCYYMAQILQVQTRNF